MYTCLGLLLLIFLVNMGVLFLLWQSRVWSKKSKWCDMILGAVIGWILESIDNVELLVGMATRWIILIYSILVVLFWRFLWGWESCSFYPFSECTLFPLCTNFTSSTLIRFEALSMQIRKNI